jgi:hypothetical protein
LSAIVDAVAIVVEHERRGRAVGRHRALDPPDDVAFGLADEIGNGFRTIPVCHDRLVGCDGFAVGRE